MASVDTLEERAEAEQLFRTFRVRRKGEPLDEGEISCPASKEAGKLTTCAACMLCGGTSKVAKSISIEAHGALAVNF